MAFAYLLSKVFGPFISEDKKVDEPWLENFVILYLTKCLTVDGDTTDIGRLARGDLDFGQDQSLLVYLKAYLSKIGKTYEVSNYKDAVAAIPRVWANHVGGFQSEGSVRAWCQDQNPEGSIESVDKFVAAIKLVDKSSIEWSAFTLSLLKFRFQRVFKRKYAIDYQSYVSPMLDDYIEPRNIGA